MPPPPPLGPGTDVNKFRIAWTSISHRAPLSKRRSKRSSKLKLISISPSVVALPTYPSNRIHFERKKIFFSASFASSKHWRRVFAKEGRKEGKWEGRNWWKGRIWLKSRFRNGGSRSTIPECFLGNSRLASWIRHGSVGLYISSRSLPLSIGICTRSLYIPPLVSPLFRFPDFHNFFRSQFFRFPISSLPPSAFLSLINAAWSMREISAGKVQFRTASKMRGKSVGEEENSGERGLPSFIPELAKYYRSHRSENDRDSNSRQSRKSVIIAM